MANTVDFAVFCTSSACGGNPRYELQVYKALIALLGSSSPKAQQMATQTLRFVQTIVGSATVGIVEPTLTLLKSLHVEVQYEACELLKDLVKYDIQRDVLQRLVTLLKPSKVDLVAAPEILKDPESAEMRAPLPVFVQQAAAAKLIGVLAKLSPEIAEALVQLGSIHGLLYAMGNDRHADSQRQAGIALEFFVRSFPLVNDAVKDALGDTFYMEYLARLATSLTYFMTSLIGLNLAGGKDNPDTMYLKMTPIQVDVLVSNRVNLSGAGEA